VEIPGTELMGTAEPYFIYHGFAFVAYPNRDSAQFIECYNIPEAETVIRGILRYQGFPEFVHVLVDMEFLSEETYDFLNLLTSRRRRQKLPSKCLERQALKSQDLVWAISSKTKFVNNEETERIIAGLERN